VPPGMGDGEVHRPLAVALEFGEHHRLLGRITPVGRLPGQLHQLVKVCRDVAGG